MLIKCRNCGSRYSEYAEKCPKCNGYMVEKGNKLLCGDKECGYITDKK